MQKWEYLRVGFEAAKEEQGADAYYLAVDGKILEPRTRDFTRVANDLGEQGWEIAINRSSDCFFKRAKF